MKYSTLIINPIITSDVVLNFKNIHTVRYGTESLSHLANRVWSLIPFDIKSSPTLESFKEKIKLWKTNKIPAEFAKPISNNLSNLTYKIKKYQNIYCSILGLIYSTYIFLFCFVDFD